MKSLVRLSLTLIAVLLISGCSSLDSIGLTNSSGFIELPFPSSNYAIGQVVEIRSSPVKVEITFDPAIPADQVAIPEGWNISTETLNSISAKTSLQMSKIISENSNQIGTEKILVTLSDIKTRMVPKYTLYKYLQEGLKKNPELNTMIKNYIDSGTKFNVITQITSAKISFTIIGTSGTGATIDADLLKKINSRMNTNFVQGDDKKTYISGSLIIGFIADPKMMKTLTLPK